MAIPTTLFRETLIEQLYPSVGDGWIVPELSKSLKTYLRDGGADTVAIRAAHLKTLEDESNLEPDWEVGFMPEQSPALIVGPTGTPTKWQTHALHEMDFQLMIEGHVRTDSISKAEEFHWLLAATIMHAQAVCRSTVSNLKFMAFVTLGIKPYKPPRAGERWIAIPLTVVGKLSVDLYRQ